MTLIQELLNEARPEIEKRLVILHESLTIGPAFDFDFLFQQRCQDFACGQGEVKEFSEFLLYWGFDALQVAQALHELGA